MSTITSLIDQIEASAAGKAALVNRLEKAWAAYADESGEDPVIPDPELEEDPKPAPGQTGIAARKFPGGTGNGVFISPVDISIGSDTYVGTYDGNTDTSWLNHAVSEDGKFESRRAMTTGLNEAHAEPSLFRYPNGEIISINAIHNDKFLNLARSTDRKNWTRESLVSKVGNGPRASFTYAKIHYLDKASGDPTYLITRMSPQDSSVWGPHISKTTNRGRTWSNTQRLFTGTRPYIVSADDGRSIHLFTNRGHPDRFDGSKDQGVYYACWRDDRLRLSNGKVLANPVDPREDAEAVYNPSGDLNTWVMDAAVTPDGRPCVTFVKYPKGIGKRTGVVTKEAFWARRETNLRWTVHKIDNFQTKGTAYGHSFGQPGIVMDPFDPRRVFLCDLHNGKSQVFRYVMTGNGFDGGKRIATSEGVGGLKFCVSRQAEPRLMINVGGTRVINTTS